MTIIVTTDHDDGSTVTFVVVRRERADVRATFVFGQRTDQNHSGDAKNIGFGNKPRFDESYTDVDPDNSIGSIFVYTAGIMISPHVRRRIEYLYNSSSDNIVERMHT